MIEKYYSNYNLTINEKEMITYNKIDIREIKQIKYGKNIKYEKYRKRRY